MQPEKYNFVRLGLQFLYFLFKPVSDPGFPSEVGAHPFRECQFYV